MTTEAPRILPIAESPRPFWSVMIPAYNPRLDYLEQALRSVLMQDPGPEQMQIKVVDDCSPKVGVEAMVKCIAGERVAFTKTPKNLGLAGCWNTCIERSRGQWVHILHQDDWVLPEFYSSFKKLIQGSPEITAAFSRHLYADMDGHWNSLSLLENRTNGVLKDFDELIAISQRIECAAVIVKRSTYELLGGYRPDIPFVLDWEMWCRIAARGCWGYVPQLGAVHRLHPESQTTHLSHTGEAVRDFLEGGQIARSHFPSELQVRTAHAFLNKFADIVLQNSSFAYAHGRLTDAARLLDSFRRIVMKSDYRMDWLWLRFRVIIKSLRLLL